MPIDPITGISGLTRSQGISNPVDVAESGGAFANFGDMLGAAMDNLNRLDNNANSAIAQLAAGEDVELHQVMIAMQEADIAFQLATQVRNKLIDAYQEVMRMQV
jgi:flagellar hook-basal body complex protein FliE